jgi:hypothetical protein
MEGVAGAELGGASVACPLTALPESLLRPLFALLPAPTLFRLALCCKHLRCVVIDDPALWRVLDLSKSVVCDGDDQRSEGAALPVLHAVLSTYGAHVEHLHLDGYSQHTVLSLFAGVRCRTGKMQQLRLLSPVVPGDLCRPEAAPMQTLDSVSRLLAALVNWGEHVVVHVDLAVPLDASLPSFPERHACIRLRNVFIAQHGDPFTRGTEVSSAGVHALTAMLARGIASCPRGVYLRAFTPNHMALSHIKNLRGLQELALFPPPGCEAAAPLQELSIIYSPAAAVMAWPLDSVRDARGPLFRDDGLDDQDLGPPADFFDNALCAVHPCGLLTLHTLCLRGNGLDGDAFTRGLVRTVRRLLRRGTSVPLTSLDLRDNRLRDAGCASLALLWPRPHGDSACPPARFHLQTLKLAGNGITSAGIEALATGLASPYCELTTLDLGGSKLCAASCGYIARALTTGSTLTSLDAYHCSVNDSGAAMLAAALSVSGSLTHLRLGRNCITDDGCVALCGAMQGNTSCGLTSLDLSYNAISAAGGLALADALRSPGCKLRVLNLRINQLGATGCAAVGVAGLEAWQLHGQGLTKLVLARNLMTDDAATAIAAAMAACADAPTDLELDVGHNDTTAVGHQALLRAAAALGRGKVTLRGVDGTVDLDEAPSPGQQLVSPPLPLATEAMDVTQWGALLL